MIAIYVRQSVDKKDSISIESQIEKCKFELNGDENYKVYADKGFSGKNINRPEFAALFDDIKNNKISKVVVYKIDRISRAIVDFGRIMEQLDKYQVEFVSYTEKFDTSSPIGRAMLNIIMVFAQLERETIQQRVKDNYYERGRQGYYLGGRAPFGFKKIETRLNNKKTYTFEPIDSEAALVKELFEDYANTETSLSKLSSKLTGKGMLTNSGSPWGGVSLGRLLRNPVYVQSDVDVYSYLLSKGASINNDVSEFVGMNGCYVYAERKNITTSKFTDLSESFVTLALHEGMIPSELWLRCQYKMDGNKQLKNSGKGTHSWLSGIMKCGYCGYAVNVVNNGRGNSYINCGGRKLRVCYDRKKSIILEDIERAVEGELLSYLESISKTIINDKDTQVEDKDLNPFKMRLVQIEDKINHLLLKMAQASSITMDYINKEISRLDTEKNQIFEEMAKERSCSKKIRKFEYSIDDIINHWDEYEVKMKNSIAKSLIDTVSVKDDCITVLFI